MASSFHCSPMDSKALLAANSKPPVFFPAAVAKASPNPPSDAFRSKPRQPPAVRALKAPKFAEADAFPDSLPLHSKNPHAIYKDIQRFARLGQLKKALTILDYLEHRGVPVNTTTFSALLAACSRLKALAFGRQIHVHLRIHGLESNEFILAKLVEMYASCGSPDDARRVFAELSPKSVYPWNALLKGNVAGGPRWGHVPLAVFSEMRGMGVDANEYTFSCLLKSFAGSPAFAQGTKAHALLIKNGFASASVLLQTCLIDMYFKCGKTHMAMKVFDEITERDIVLWGAVIAGFAHNGLRWEALKYLRWMGSEGIEPNSVIVTSILPVIGELAERHLGREIHAFVLKRFRNYDKMVFVQSGLIDMYCKCRDMVSGRRVFYGSNERNAVSWTALMSGYASNSRFEQSLRSVVWMQQEGIKPDVVSIATAVPVCAQLKALRQGKELHAYAVKNWFLPNVSMSTSLMTMYSACGNLEYSCRLFDMMEKKNVLAWTALVDSYLKNGCPYDALHVFRSMLQANRRPDVVALARILNTCGEIGALKLGREAHGQLLKMKLESAPIAIAEVVKMYGKCRDVETARKVYDRTETKGSLSCTSIIEAYGFNSQYKEAIYLFNSMLLNGFVPNHFMFDAILRIYERAESVDAALRIFNMMIQEYDLKASEENYDCIINLLTRVGRINEAQKFLYLRSMLLSV
ncbi:pentatricopeptide repeat-containing protein At1g71460, chloroplastic-like [Musa acuminata AAA Group]|uniref:pentatricopeptide repeat-containing protein At1g71460, chloroplastic-like n=1 Tax=Musa acuminata AAA Group TaxID=214697 RepID=UPI0031D81C2B